ncbi:MAG: DUF3137 domain-containing protein [Verrucomicrobiales bacterium]|nr:DUF3137 domain-containing protein [Verrucomicrobiales bacterium]
MKSNDQIIATLLPTLEQLEPDRLLYRKRSKVYLAGTLIPTLALVGAGIVFRNSGIFLFIGAGVWLVVGLILYQVKAASIGSRFKSGYKKTVIPALLSSIDSSLTHSAERGIPSSSFVESELFRTRPDRYTTEDLIEGRYGKTYLQLAEVNAQQRQTSTDSKGRTTTRYVTFFDGLFLIADFHKHFHGRTFVFPDKAEKSFGGFARFFQKMGGRSQTDLIQMDDPEFERDFKVYATDQVEARYVLSNAMMRRILAMQKRFGKDVRLGFKQSSLMLAVPHHHSYLEPGTNLAATDKGQVIRMLNDIRYFLETVEELDLNTRIWTKE